MVCVFSFTSYCPSPFTRPNHWPVLLLLYTYCSCVFVQTLLLCLQCSSPLYPSVHILPIHYSSLQIPLSSSCPNYSYPPKKAGWKPSRFSECLWNFFFCPFLVGRHVYITALTLKSDNQGRILSLPFTSCMTFPKLLHHFVSFSICEMDTIAVPVYHRFVVMRNE